MAKVHYQSGMKGCANCIYWCGERTAEPIRKCFVVEMGSTGKCSKTLAPRLCNAACSSYELHPICK